MRQREIQAGTLAQDYSYHGNTYPTGSFVSFYNNGQPKWIEFSGRLTINGITFRGNRSIDEIVDLQGAQTQEADGGNPVLFYPSGEIMSGRLDKKTELNGLPFVDLIYFHKNQQVLLGMVDHNQMTPAHQKKLNSLVINYHGGQLTPMQMTVIIRLA